MCLADLAPAWISFQAIVPPWFNAYARTRVRNTLFRQSFVVFSDVWRRGSFGVKQGGFFAEQALQPAFQPYRHIGTLPRSSGVAVAVRVFPVL